MKLLMVSPGASYSTVDVFRGLYSALKEQGHELVPYALDARIDNAAKFLNALYRQDRENYPQKPTPEVILYLAGQGVLENALRHQVDWVVAVSAMYLHPDWLILLRRAGVRTAVVFTESPYDDDRQLHIAPFIDVCFTNERTSVAVLEQVHPNVTYLPHAYNPAFHYPGAVAADTPAHDVVFVGTGFRERIELLRAVDWTGIDFGLYGEWNGTWLGKKLRPYWRGGVTPNRETAALYRNAKIGLNLYRESMGFGIDAPRITHAESLNPRAYELAACGVFSLSSYRAEVRELFGEAVPMFRTAAELEALIRAYLADDEKRRAAAECLPDLVALQTFAARTEILIETLEAAARPRLLTTAGGY